MEMDYAEENAENNRMVPILKTKQDFVVVSIFMCAMAIMYRNKLNLSYNQV